MTGRDLILDALAGSGAAGLTVGELVQAGAAGFRISARRALLDHLAAGRVVVVGGRGTGERYAIAPEAA